MTQPVHGAVGSLKKLRDETSSLLGRVRSTLATSPMPQDQQAAVTMATNSVEQQAAIAGDVANADPTVVEEPLHVAMHNFREAMSELGRTLDCLNKDTWTSADKSAWASVASWVNAHTGDVRRLHERVINTIEAVTVPQHGSPSVGFEYQLGDAKVAPETTPSKTVLKRWYGRSGAEILRLEVDGSNVEFITAPVTTQKELDEQLTHIEQEVEVVSRGRDTGVVYTTPDNVRSDVDGHVLLPAGTKVAVTHGGGTVRGKIQATAGRRLDQLSKFIIKYGGKSGRSTLDAIRDEPAVGNARPLLHLVNFYITALESGAPNEPEGPKVLLQVMSRTDFHSVYLLLTPEERDSFKACIDYEGGRGQLGGLRPRRIAGRGYLGPAGAKHEGPLVGDWLDSIVLGDVSTTTTEPIDRDNDGAGPRGASRDMLSPPEGYPAHRRGRHFTYAMGRFGTAADGALLLEVRAIKEDMSYNVSNLRDQSTGFLEAQLL